MEERKIPVDYLGGGLKAQQDTEENWKAKHSSCPKDYQKSFVNGREWKFIVCLKHSEVFVK